MTEEHKRTENRLRKLADHQGYALRKSRRCPSPDNFGEYMLVDTSTNFSVLGHRYDADLEDVEAFLR